MEAIPGKNDYSEDARNERLNFIAQKSGQHPATVGASSLPAEGMKGHIENFIGSIQIPLGLAGPLHFNGTHVDGVVYAPFATSEGALVASACRGARLLSTAGGVTTQFISQTMHRAPSFVLSNLRESVRLKTFIEDHFADLQGLVKEGSRYLKLQDVIPMPIGRTLHCIMHFETGDAAGQNMVTFGGERLARWIIEHAQKKAGIQVLSFQVEGGMNSDKKANAYSFIKGRGVRVAAECLIPDAIFQSVFRMDAQTVYDHYRRATPATAVIGGLGHTVNIANVIAAIFTATGQDIGSVHESSIGYLQMEKERDALYLSLTLPSLLVGTVGGGTSLPTQKEALNMIGCAGAGNKARLAEIIVGFCLALDISTWSSIANHTFADAHQRLGRAP